MKSVRVVKACPWNPEEGTKALRVLVRMPIIFKIPEENKKGRKPLFYSIQEYNSYSFQSFCIFFSAPFLAQQPDFPSWYRSWNNLPVLLHG